MPCNSRPARAHDTPLLQVLYWQCNVLQYGQCCNTRRISKLFDERYATQCTCLLTGASGHMFRVKLRAAELAYCRAQDTCCPRSVHTYKLKKVTCSKMSMLSECTANACNPGTKRKPKPVLYASKQFKRRVKHKVTRTVMQSSHHQMAAGTGNLDRDWKESYKKKHE